MSKNKDIKKMTRWEIIQELRKHAHPSWFQSLLDRTTPTLRALLFYYQNGGNEEGRRRLVVKFQGATVIIPEINPKPKQ